MKVIAQLDAFCDMLWLEDGLTPKSLESYRRDLTQLADWLGERTLETATGDELEAFLAERSLKHKVSARSLARQLSALKRYYRWLVRE